MIRDLLRRPLEQAMVFLWLLTLVQLLSRFSQDQVSYSWAGSAALAGLLALLLASRYHLMTLISLPIVLELAACLVFLQLIGLETNALALAAVLFALSLWWISQHAVSHLHNRFGRHVYDDVVITTDKTITITQATLCLIVACAVSVQLVNAALFNAEAEHSVSILLTLLLAMLFLWWSRKPYPYALNSYLTLLLLIVSIMEWLSLSLYSVSFLSIKTDHYAGFLFVTIGLGLCLMTNYLQWLAHEDQVLYRTPLLVIATGLAVFAFLVQFLQLITLAAGQVRPLDVAVAFLAGILLLISSFRLRSQALSFIALLMLVTATMWLLFSGLHAGTAFSLWLQPRTFPDQWLILALLSLLLSMLAFFLEYSRSPYAEYSQSLTNVAAVTYLWALLGALQLFFYNPAAESLFLPWLWLVLLAGQMPVLRAFPYADRIRAICIVLLLLILLATSTTVLHLSGALRMSNALLAYALLLASAWGLPKWNRRFLTGSVSPGFWPWAGLALLYSCFLQGGPEWIFQWPWLLLVVFFQLLMRKPFLDLPALLLGVLTLLWAQGALLHPHAVFSLMPMPSTSMDIWFSLSAIALLFSLLSHSHSTRLASRLSRPFYHTAWLCFTWALTGGIVLFASAAEDKALMTWVFLLLFMALFSLSGSWPNGARIRGIGSGCLLTLTVMSCARQWVLPLPLMLVIYSYSLWWLSCWAVSRFNQKYASLALEQQSWAWLGLLLMVVSGLTLDGFATLEAGGYWLALSGYCLLMHRYSSLALLSWFAALFFALVGPTIGSIYLREIDPERIDLLLQQLFSVVSFMILLCLNLQLALARFWQRTGKEVVHRWACQRDDIGNALLFFADVVLLGGLLCYAYYVFVFSLLIPVIIAEKLRFYVIASSLMLSLSFAHALGLSSHPVRLHGLIFACFTLAWAIYDALPLTMVHPSLYMALCGAMLVTMYYRVTVSPRQQVQVKQVLNWWAQIGLLSASGALLVNRDYSLQAFLLNLGVVTGITAFYGLWTLHWKWFTAACLEFLVFLHCWPLLWLTLADLDGLYPWYSLQTALLAWLFLLLIKRSSLPEQIQTASDGRKAMSLLAFRYWPWLVTVSLTELVIHIVLVFNCLMKPGFALWLLPPLDTLAALAAGLIISGIGVRHVKKSPDSRWVYGILVLTAVLGFYLRLLTLGIEPLGFWDTSLLIVFAYILLLLHRGFPSRPLLNLTLLMPLFALLTVPFQLESPSASLTLLLTGVFYLLIRRNDPQRQLPVYLALLAFNSGVYLWVPGFVEHSHLLQIYVIPVALSILVLLQLHCHELKQTVLMASRLAALSVIYAAATLDVFLLPGLKIFMLAMSLSLAGLILGIAMRVRAYLYAGVIFLLLNVIGQFLNYYPEQMLGKAIVLMILGSLIIAVMIWFNIKRAEILQQFRGIQDELESWE